MEKKFSLTDYLTQTFMVYGITVALLNIFCLQIGQKAQALSSIFALGSQGIPVSACLEFLPAIAVVVALKYVFMTDWLIADMPLAARITALFACVFVVVTVFVLLFGWFPADDAAAWILFLLCFSISCAASITASLISQRKQNRELSEALNRFKEEE